MYDFKRLLKSKSILSSLTGLAFVANHFFPGFGGLVDPGLITEPVQWSAVGVAFAGALWGRLVAKTKISGLL